MATQDQMLEQMKAMQGQIKGLLEMLVKGREEKMSDKSGGSNRTGDLVEKLVKRTEVFGGEGFSEWKFRVATNFRACYGP